jgi:hypothetical protein
VLDEEHAEHGEPLPLLVAASSTVPVPASEVSGRSTMQGCKKFMRACHFQVMDPGRIDRSVVPRPSPGSKSGWHQSTVRVHVRVPRRPLPAVRARERRGDEMRGELLIKLKLKVPP